MNPAKSEHNGDRSDGRTKPAFLRRVRIRGYKSLASCDVPLQPLTVLVGRNGSGKSNFLDALAFVRDAVKINLPEAVKLHGGLPSICCRLMVSQGFTIEIQGGFQLPSGSDYLADYHLGIIDNGARPAGFSHRERLLLRESSTGKEEGFHLADGKLRWFGSDIQLEHPPGVSASGNQGILRFGLAPSGSATIELEKFSLPSGHLVLGLVGHEPAVAFAQALGAMSFYNFYPSAVRRLQRPTPGYWLEPDGGNLPSVLGMLKEIDAEALQRAKDYLSRITPEINDFDTVRYGEYETIQFHLGLDAGRPEIVFDAASMSDGTLRALAAIMAVSQIVLPYGHPSLIGIDEPETSLHPAAVHALVSALEAATEHTQVLLTTQSGDLLADPKLSPSSVLVVRQKKGRTEIAPVDPASREIIRQELYTLADLQRLDQLNPDEEDLERQAAMMTPEG
jgi:predicted ATPase